MSIFRAGKLTFHNFLAIPVMLLFLVMFTLSSSALAGERNQVKPEIPSFRPGDVPVKWGEIGEKTISLFYPGQATWDWLVNPQKDFTHPGAMPSKSGVTCRTRHVKGGMGPDEEALGKNTSRRARARTILSRASDRRWTSR